MKMSAKISSFVGATISFLLSAPSAFAVDILCSDGVSVDTALGCVPIELDKFIAWFLPVLFGVGGTIAFLLMVYGFILMTMSNGDPKAIQGAKETITSALIGLLISIFAIFIFRLVALNILKIPGIS
ncbi:hypothetical protein KKD37_00575 [Patescibacteria group bacterium]|nr:hypothetical protein [Patescibacteria group bacterium]